MIIDVKTELIEELEYLWCTLVYGYWTGELQNFIFILLKTILVLFAIIVCILIVVQ